jgi:hypothetical protein
MMFAYADPPYLGLAASFYGDRHPEAADYDRPEMHATLPLFAEMGVADA